MRSHYDIGLVGVWFGLNYGSSLTYYSLQNELKKLGFSVLMIDKPIQNSKDKEVLPSHSRRFAEEFFDISERYSLENLYLLNDICDNFFVGSDQVWNYGVSKGFGKMFYLDFVDDKKPKFSYAASFGHGVDFAPQDERCIISQLLNKFNFISVREDSGVKICKDIYGVSATQVLDPVFFLESQDLINLCKRSTLNEEKDYLLAYILDVTEEKKELLLHISKQLNLRPIIILDGFKTNLSSDLKLLNMDENVRTNFEIFDWLNLFNNANFILTDSFHGMCFSILFQKQFICLPNKKRGIARFQSLGNLLDISNRLIFDPLYEIKDQKFKNNINYQLLNNKFSEELSKSKNWLYESINSVESNVSKYPKKFFVFLKTIKDKISSISSQKNFDKAVVNVLDQQLCVGCSACVNICKNNALSISQDVLGYYRSKLDEDKCVNCGICASACPSLKPPLNNNSTRPTCSVFIASDFELLKNSSSGGAFSILAKEIFRRKGIVVGAAWQKDFSVAHELIDTEKELFKLQKSKYLQSYIGNIFIKIKNILDQNRFLLFSGCPCQVAGLKKFLKKDYENLILVDLLCSHAPSTLFFKKYISESFTDELVEYNFRDKSLRYDCNVINYTLKDGNRYVKQGGEEDLYQRVYHNHTMCSVHCENCKFQKLPRFGDITIGDFWGISKRDKSIDVKNGVSAVLCNNKKGEDFFASIPDNQFSLRKNVPLNWLGNNGFTVTGKNWISPNRNAFYAAIPTMSFSKASNLALKPTYALPLDIYKDTNSLLQFDSRSIHFRFDPEIWEEHYINGETVLIVKKQNPGIGKYATLLLLNNLMSNAYYNFSIKYKIKTNSDKINFHIKDSGTNFKQVILSKKLSSEEKRGINTIYSSCKFSPKSNIFDEFMIGALHLSGSLNFISISYINIVKI